MPKVKQDIFDSVTSPTRSCHASTIVASGERLIAAWFGGEFEKHPEVAIFCSTYDGSSWSAPAKVADGRQPDGRRVACWNPVLFEANNETLLLFYKIGAEISGWQTWVKESRDHGETWSEARHLGGGIEGPVKNKPIAWHGKLLCPSSSEPDWHNWLLYFSIGDLKGERWRLVGPINEPFVFQAIQPTILTHPDGRLQALCRTRQGVIAQTWSADDGETWSQLSATQLQNPNSGIDAVTLADKRHLLVYNDALKGRSPLDVAVSRDGLHWDKLETLESGEGEYSYPAVIQTDDGSVHITYTNNRRTITHCVVSV